MTSPTVTGIPTNHRGRRLAAVALSILLAPAAVLPAQASTAPALALPPGCSQPAVGDPITCTFSFTGVAESFTVPDRVAQVTVTAYGGHGATPDQSGALPGGSGGVATGTFGVTPGDTLTVSVGGDGVGFQGGFGYGRGGSSDFTTLGAGGGGGSAVQDDAGDPLVVAGGGGGGGLESPCSLNGAGGDAGHDGGAGAACGATAGGGGGTAGAAPGPDGTTGPQRLGGGGGGGGGGYRGGTGGQGIDFDPQVANYTGAGGGGGGSSFAAPSGTNTSIDGISTRGNGANGLVTISYEPVGDIVSLELDPASAAAAVGEAQPFTVIGVDADGARLDVTADSTFSIEPDGSCIANACGADSPGEHTVTAGYTAGATTLTATAELTATLAPSFTSPGRAVFRAQRPGSFTIATNGAPAAGLSVTSGRLPRGLVFADNGDGTATVDGTPAGRSSTRDLVITASNSTGVATQQLRVVVRPVTTQRCRGLEVTVVGTSRDDVLRGTAGRDVILAGAGDDVVTARGGVDLVCGGRGDDVLRGGGGSDRLIGSAGRDRLAGQAGDDALWGGPGHDVVRGGPGLDRYHPSGGHDDVVL